jgi:hypothetical protein
LVENDAMVARAVPGKSRTARLKAVLLLKIIILRNPFGACRRLAHHLPAVQVDGLAVQVSGLLTAQE